MASNQSSGMRDITIEAARIQLASLNAGITFWTGWLESASKFAEQINATLMDAYNPKADSSKIVGRITDASKTFLGQTTKLSSQSVDQFNQEMMKATKKRKRSRSGKVKP
jgi:hypothetical protein